MQILPKIWIFTTLLIFSSSGCHISQRYDSPMMKDHDILNQVKNHYIKSSDSLKLRAAEFLLSNINGHYSLSGNHIDSLQRWLYTTYEEKPFWIKDAVINYFLSSYKELSNKRYDSEILDSTFLISYIDRIIGQREKYNWYKDYSFDDFCEYILPYRLKNEWIDTSAQKYRSIIELNEKISDAIAIHSLYFQGNKKYIETKLSDALYQLGIEPFLKDLNETKLKYNIMLSCEEEAAAECYLYNSVGIPRVYDFVPHWANQNGRHAWATSPYDLEKPAYNYAKIYRRTFSHNPSPETDRPYETIPELFKEPFHKDVTALYGDTGDLSLKLSRQRRNFDNIYLHVFNGGAWHPVAWKRISGKSVHFSDLGKGVVYLPGYCSDEGLITEGFPIILGQDSSCQELIPDIERTQIMRLFRKYPMTPEKIERVDALCGAVILGYVNGSQNPDTLAVIPPDYMIRGTIKLNCRNRFRYIKIVAERVMQIAEIKLFDKAMRPVDFAPLSNDYNEIAVKDADNLTYSYIIPEITLSVNDDKQPCYLKIMPRNDDNWINEGEVYELFYFGTDGWISCGEKRAVADYVEYSNVPSEALYLLRNLSKGTEERPFTWQDGKMVFW